MTEQDIQYPSARESFTGWYRYWRLWWKTRQLEHDLNYDYATSFCTNCPGSYGNCCKDNGIWDEQYEDTYAGLRKLQKEVEALLGSLDTAHPVSEGAKAAFLAKRHGDGFERWLWAWKGSGLAPVRRFRADHWMTRKF